MPPDAAGEAAPAQARCPACDGRLFPRELECADCGLHVRTSYPGNEFARLDGDALHLLRIFVACEGRIRDMERALGVSYPTVKSRLASLRETLGFAPRERGRRGETRTGTAPQRPAADQPEDVIGALERGEIDFDEAMKRLKRG